MRTFLVVIVMLLVVAVGFLLIKALSSEGPSASTVADSDNAQEVAALRNELVQMQQLVEQLQSQVEELETQAQAAQAVDSAEKAAAERVKKTAKEQPREATAKAGNTGEKGAVVAQMPEDGLRKIIRDEMKNMEEEKRRENEERINSWKAEGWEIEEFGEMASFIHRAGVVLDLTDKQKRQYHPIVKEHGDRMRNLWKEIQGSNPGAERNVLQKLYKEEKDRILKNTREQVEGILMPEQRKKYRDEIKKKRMSM